MVPLSVRTTTQSALIGLAAAMSCATGAQAKDLQGGFIQPGQATAAPRGFVEMCESGVEPRFCSPTRPMVAGAALITAGLSERAGEPVPHLEAALPKLALPVTGISAAAPMHRTRTDCAPPSADARLGLVDRLNSSLTIAAQIGTESGSGCPLTAPSLSDVATPWQRFEPPALIPAVAWRQDVVGSLAPPTPPEVAQLANAALWQRPGPCAFNSVGNMLMAVVTQLCTIGPPDTPMPLPPSPDTPPAPRTAPDVTAIPTALPEADLKKLLKRVNRHVNGRVRQRTDAEIYGVGELWRRSGVGQGAVGDCEDLAIEKRAELIADGFPPDRLAFAVVYSRASGLHTVLVARTDTGDVVLDGRSPYVTGWSEVAYSWISIQSMNDPMLWYAPSNA